MLLPFEKPIGELEEKIQELKDIMEVESDKSEEEEQEEQEEQEEEKDKANGKKVKTSKPKPKPKKAHFPELAKLEEERIKLIQKIYKNLSRWQTVQVSRHQARPTFLDYTKLIFKDFIELHGDRSFGDDKAIVCGFGYLEDDKCILIGHQKGKDMKDNVERNFGMPRPEGYRKALRIMELGQKFNIPIITFIDTPGAYPGMDAEERGQSEAIAKNLFRMPTLRVPIINVVIGEGGSGGALALGTGDKVLMLKYSIYSVISPEGCASILWKDASKASEAAETLKLTATDLLEFNIIDEIVEEPIGGAHRNPNETANNIKMTLLKHLKELKKLSVKRMLEKRYSRRVEIGAFKKKK